jgi:anti-sigma factor ChrR (cupin superfamily)
MALNVNADFSRRAVVHAAAMPWTPSPIPGVDRRMLDRIGDEIARATSVVRYAPGSRFSSHVHGGGEEFLVLEGIFQDEHGDYPSGTYVRNPPNTSHRPGTAQGAVILVKLWQFDPADRTAVCVDTRSISPVSAGSEGVRMIPLFENRHETVRLEIWRPNAHVKMRDHKGLEVFALEGGFEEGGEHFVRHSWLRLPPGEDFAAIAGPEGATVWLKSGHLAATPIAPRMPRASGP